MLKLAPPGRGRRALGLLLLAGLALAGTGAVQALDAGTATSAAPPQIELKLDLRYETRNGDKRETYGTQPTLRVALGQRAVVMLNGNPEWHLPEPVAVIIEATDLGDGRIQLQAELQKGDPLATVSRPRLITHNGVKALIEQGRDDPSVNEQLSLAITPTLLAQQP